PTPGMPSRVCSRPGAARFRRARCTRSSRTAWGTSGGARSAARTPGARARAIAAGSAGAGGPPPRLIETRLKELGQPIPNPSSVGLSVIQKLQARLAPAGMGLDRMEAAEEEEITDRYKRSTGDPDTDAVLQAIRVEEQGHSRSLESMQVAHQAEPKQTTVQSRLDRILGREKWHRTGAGWISGAIYGANDGLA